MDGEPARLDRYERRTAMPMTVLAVVLLFLFSAQRQAGRYALLTSIWCNGRHRTAWRAQGGV